MRLLSSAFRQTMSFVHLRQSNVLSDALLPMMAAVLVVSRVDSHALDDTSSSRVDDPFNERARCKTHPLPIATDCRFHAKIPSSYQQIGEPRYPKAEVLTVARQQRSSFFASSYDESKKRLSQLPSCSASP